MEKTIYTDRYKRLILQLKEARTGKNLTQVQAGKLIGVSRSWPQKVEGCQLRLDCCQLRTLCRAYGLTFIEILKEFDGE